MVFKINISCLAILIFFSLGCSERNKKKILDSNGVIQEEYEVNDKGEVNGNYIFYFNNGDTNKILHYSNGVQSGLCKEFYLNKKLKRIYYYENNIKQGDYTMYDSVSGSLIRKGKYLNDKFSGLYKKYNNNILTDLIQMLDDSVVWSVSLKPNNNEFLNVKNYIEINYSDTALSNLPFEVKISVKNCTFNGVTFYEGKIANIGHSYKLKDTVGVFSSINDSTVILRKSKLKQGRNIIEGILFCTEKNRDTTLYYPYVILEQFYVKCH